MSEASALLQIQQATAALDQVEEATQACVSAVDQGNWPLYEQRKVRVHALLDVFLDGYASAAREIARGAR